jgi:methylenetetrahydrofolate dehydrogenase (NAD+)
LFSLYHNQRFIDPRKLALAAQVTSPTPAITAPSQLAATVNSAAKESSTTTDNSLVKAILPCTPLAIVKTLEHCQVYNPLLPYGGRAYGKTITVINR